MHILIYFNAYICICLIYLFIFPLNWLLCKKKIKSFFWAEFLSPGAVNTVGYIWGCVILCWGAVLHVVVFSSLYLLDTTSTLWAGSPELSRQCPCPLGAVTLS